MPIDTKPYPLILPPAEKVVWRYMQFPKLISLLISKSLYFSRCDKLQSDPWEGMYPPNNFDQEALTNALITQGWTREAAEKYAVDEVSQKDSWIKLRETFAVSCWHVNETESDAFWRIYSRMDEGVAIRTTFGRLTASLAAQQKRSVFPSLVTYADYKKIFLPKTNVFYPVLFKRDSFAHERELRLFIWALDSLNNEPPRPFDDETGESVPCDLELLIEEIIISPLAPEWLVRDTQSLISRLGFAFSCKQSNLLKYPA